MRFRFDEHRPVKGTREQADEEQRVSREVVHWKMWAMLLDAGLIERSCPKGGAGFRLTRAGHDALDAGTVLS